MNNPRQFLLTGLFLAATVLSARAGSFTANFDSGALPPGSHTNSNVNGGAFLELTGGVGNSGCLKLTKNVNSQNGSFVLDDLDNGNPIYGFEATFKIRIGGGSGTPADGMAFCVAPDFSDTTIFGETGAGSGLRVTWGIYTGSGQNPPDPAIRIRTGDTVVAYKGYTVAGLRTGGTDASTWWADCRIRLSPDGALSMDYQGANVFTNFYVPGYENLVNSGAPMRFAFGARTGGLNENFWIDDLQITTYTTSQVSFRQHPLSQKAQQGDAILLEAQVSNNNGVTLQWMSNNVAIAGANFPILTITNVQPSLSGSKYKLVATGPNNTVTSAEATITVINLSLPNPPQMSFNFNDGLTPAGVTLTGTATVDAFGGIGDSGCVKLVNPIGTAAMLVADPAPATILYGFTARFKLLVGGGSVPPADGAVFAFGTDIPDDPTGEFERGQGLGTGLRVAFDIYNNDVFGYNGVEGQQPAPSIDVRFGNQVIGSVQLPLSFMESGLNEFFVPDYMDVIIQLNPNGTLNVVYHGALVFENLPIPAFGSFGASTNSTGSRFALAARTGSLNDNFWVDNFELTTVTTSSDTRIVQQPVAQTVLVNRPATFSFGVNDPTGVSFQWFRNGAAIAGATASTYTIPGTVMGDSGVLFKAQATKGPINLVSEEVGLTVVNLTAPTTPTVSYNFDNGTVPAGTAVYGTGENGGPAGGYITANGGVTDSGVFHITDNVNGQQGAFVIAPLLGGAQVSAISVAFDVRLGGGSGNPADGFSFNFASNLTDGTGGNEGGNGNGLSICFDIYGGLNDTPPAPYLGVRYKNALVASIQVPKIELETGDTFRRLLLRVDPDGKLYLAYGDRIFWNGLQLPNYSFTSGGKFGFYGRTGGEHENQWIDNVQIQVTQSSGPLAIAEEPQDVLLLAGKTGTFSVIVSDPNGATYQWFKNGATIAGATASTYTTPATTVADHGSLFKVRATGPSGTANSREALLSVIAPITVSNPQIIYDFNDGALPALPNQTILNAAGGGGYIDFFGGVTNSGVLKLTDAIGSQGGTFIIPDFNAGQPVKAFTAYWAMRLGGGTVPPADGVSFVWTEPEDIAVGSTFGEAGAGDNLIVNFDLWNNNGEAPSFNIFYRNNLVATKMVNISELETGDNFADAFVRVNSDGKIDVQYKGNVIFNQVALPGYTPVTGGAFAWGGRTGGSHENQWVDNIVLATTVGQIQVPIGFIRNGANLQMTWGAGFKLQSTPSLTNPNWQDVVNATSPHTVPMSGPGQFFRLINLP